MARDITRIGVVGLGTMGAGIVEVCARGGFEVVGIEMEQAAADRGRGHLERSTRRGVDRGKMTAEDRDALLARVTTATDMNALADCDLVVEAVPEVLDIKRSVFARVAEVVAADAVLATNTSSLSVTDIAAATPGPERVVGLHFFNPAPVQKLVEIVETVLTSADVLDGVTDLARRLGKKPVVVGDRAGFIANRLLLVHLNRAVAMVENGHASAEDVDAAMTLGCGLPMGPLTLLDLIGLDVSLAILRTIHAETGDRLHAPSPLLTRMVSAGLLGRKTGQGFYTYGEAAAETTPEEVAQTRRRLAVVGTGPQAAALAEAFSGAGVDVDRVDGTDPAAAADAGMVVVATPEEDQAREWLSRLDGACPHASVLATTVTSVPVVDLARSTARPSRVVGLTLPQVPSAGRASGTLVELVPTVLTDSEVTATALAACRAAGLHPVVSRDRAGRIVEALLCPYLDDAVAMVESGYAEPDDIDLAMQAGCGYPVGPIEVLDRFGLDATLACLRRMHDETGEPGLAPSPLLTRLVAAGRFGGPEATGVRQG